MRITKNQTNRVPLTLTEKATTNDSEWIIAFTNELSGQTKVLAVDDISEYQERSNIFLITESDTEDLSNGTISLSLSGQWIFTAYEMAPSSPRNLDVSDALAECESGIVKVIDTTESQTNNFEEDDSINNGVFDDE